MKFSTGQLNGRMLALLGVLISILLGFSWWQYLYTPALTSRDSARTARDSAQQALEVDTKKLNDAQAAQAGSAPNPDNDSKEIGKIQIAKTAIPRGDTLLPAVQQIESIVKKTGVNATINEISNSEAASGGGSGPSTSSSLQLDGHASFASLSSFIREINDTGRVYRGKVYISNRLLRVGGLSIDTDGGSTGSVDPATGTTSTPTGSTDIPKGHVRFSMTIIFYMEQARATDATTAGGATASGGAAAANGQTGSNAAAGSSGVSPNAAGGSGTAPVAGTTTSGGSGSGSQDATSVAGAQPATTTGSAS
jgi:hypothetical protein